MTHSYLRDPDAIYRRSFETARAETDLSAFDPDEAAVAIRVVHAAGDPAIVGDLRFSEGGIAAGIAALSAGGPVICDCAMVAAGITRRLLPRDNSVIVTIDDPSLPERARVEATTRSAAQVALWRNRLDGAVVAIGNAPTALFRLLEEIEAGAPAPALILGFPVGFVGAAESKAALVETGLPHAALLGRRGGSAMAAAAVNALSILAREPAGSAPAGNATP
jgi:precorrin-8X/cobalt-precorrin-8 methylmutase